MNSRPNQPKNKTELTTLQVITGGASEGVAVATSVYLISSLLNDTFVDAVTKKATLAPLAKKPFLAPLFGAMGIGAIAMSSYRYSQRVTLLAEKEEKEYKRAADIEFNNSLKKK